MAPKTQAPRKLSDAGAQKLLLRISGQLAPYPADDQLSLLLTLAITLVDTLGLDAGEALLMWEVAVAKMEERRAAAGPAPDFAPALQAAQAEGILPAAARVPLAATLKDFAAQLQRRFPELAGTRLIVGAASAAQAADTDPRREGRAV